MPLIHSKSDDAFKKNVSTLMGEVGKSPHVQSREQALAIAYSTKRRGKADGGSVDPDVQKIMDDNKMRNLVHFYLGKPQGRAEGGDVATPTGRQQLRDELSKGKAAYESTLPKSNIVLPMPMLENAIKLRGFAMGGMPQQMPQQQGIQPMMQGARPPMGGMLPQMPPGGMPPRPMPPMPPRRFALGGAPAPWFVRNEARSMVHSGPVMSAVPGRTDKHNVNVATGSYVLPADHVSSMGQGNTQAGFATLGKMFGRPMAIPHGHPPPTPRFAPMKMAGFGKKSDEGGSRGSDAGGPVPIVVAGGEYVIPPEKVAEIGGGDLKRGHEVLDHWVKTNREKHIKTLKGLPAPAKK